jgi:DNA-directed RNA polymerase specialized sigma24 family protein
MAGNDNMRQNLAKSAPAVRIRSAAYSSSRDARRSLPALEGPGAFQRTILRALELPKADRDVFLLKEIQGYSLAEIEALLGITFDTALVRLKRARREIGHCGDPDTVEPS